MGEYVYSCSRQITEREKKEESKKNKIEFQGRKRKWHQVKYPANRAICMSRAYSWKMYTW